MKSCDLASTGSEGGPLDTASNVRLQQMVVNVFSKRTPVNVSEGLCFFQLVIFQQTFKVVAINTCFWLDYRVVFLVTGSSAGQ
jgi:hypothetical protein